LIFIHSKASNLQEPSSKLRSTPPNEAQALPRGLIPLVETGYYQEQILDYKQPSKKDTYIN